MGLERVFNLEKPVLYDLVEWTTIFLLLVGSSRLVLVFILGFCDACVVDIVVQALSLQLFLGGLLLWGSREWVAVVGGERLGLLR